MLSVIVILSLIVAPMFRNRLNAIPARRAQPSLYN
jgi:hypothetical protein